MSVSDINLVLPFLKPNIRKYKKGENVATMGDMIKDVCILLQGEIYMVYENIYGARTLISRRLPKDSFFEAFCFAGAEIPVNARVKADSIVMFIPCENITNMPQFLSRHHIKMLHNVVCTMSHKVSGEIFKQLKHTQGYSVRVKILSYLNEQKAKYGKNEFVIDISKTDLASYLMVDRTSLHKELALMKKDGLINFKDRKFTIKT
ncbi:MAG: Crp/Fnr family transcriptional regulator [Endomicrobia bacterium]|nr:Crp/Fnr family transcriptional regulator [Endomicrobiia bacterium]